MCVCRERESERDGGRERGEREMTRYIYGWRGVKRHIERDRERELVGEINR
jgi:hypothetical protein